MSCQTLGEMEALAIFLGLSSISQLTNPIFRQRFLVLGFGSVKKFQSFVQKGWVKGGGHFLKTSKDFTADSSPSESIPKRDVSSAFESCTSTPGGKYQISLSMIISDLMKLSFYSMQRRWGVTWGKYAVDNILSVGDLAVPYKVVDHPPKQVHRDELKQGKQGEKIDDRYISIVDYTSIFG